MNILFVSASENDVQRTSNKRYAKPSFQGVNILFVSASENDVQRTSNKRYYLPNVEIKNCNVKINGKNVFVSK